MRTHKIFTWLAIPAAAAATLLSGCGGGSNQNATPQNQTSPFAAEYVFAADAGTHSVLAYELQSTGNPSSPLSATALAGTGANYPQAIALDTTKRFLLVLNGADGYDLEAYAISSNGVSSTQVSSAILANQNFSGNTEGMTVVQPQGAPANIEYIYISTGQAGIINSFSFNSSTGALTNLTTTGVGVNDYSYTISSNTISGTSYLYSAGGSGHPTVYTYSIDPASGALTVISPLSVGTTGPVLVAANPVAGAFYSYDQGISEVYASQVSGNGVTNDPYYSTAPNPGNDIAVAPNGSAIYLSNGTAGTITYAAIGSGGAISAPAYSAAISGANLVGIAVDAASQYVLTLDHLSSTNNSVLVYPIVNNDGVATPTSVPLTGASDPIAAVFFTPTSSVG